MLPEFGVPWTEADHVRAEERLRLIERACWAEWDEGDDAAFLTWIGGRGTDHAGERIAQAVCLVSDCGTRELTGRSRERQLLDARAVTAHLMREIAGLPRSVIGRVLGGRSVSAVEQLMGRMKPGPRKGGTRWMWRDAHLARAVIEARARLYRARGEAAQADDAA